MLGLGLSSGCENSFFYLDTESEVTEGEVQDVQDVQEVPETLPEEPRKKRPSVPPPPVPSAPSPTPMSPGNAPAPDSGLSELSPDDPAWTAPGGKGWSSATVGRRESGIYTTELRKNSRATVLNHSSSMTNLPVAEGKAYDNVRYVPVLPFLFFPFLPFHPPLYSPLSSCTNSTPPFFFLSYLQGRVCFNTIILHLLDCFVAVIFSLIFDIS